MEFIYNNKFIPAPNIKCQINIGCLFDIPNGTYEEGKYGEMILNGGLSTITGVTAIGNMFKSTTMHYQTFTAMSRINGSYGSAYDTEINTNEAHLAEMADRIPEFNNEKIFDTGRYLVTDKTVYPGEKWYEIHKEFCEEKIKNFEKTKVETPFLDRDGKPMYINLPTFTEIDSFSEFETSDVTKMQNDNELGESGGNTIHMRQGLAKMRLLMEAPRLHCGSYDYLLMTAQLGKESAMQSAGGGREVPITKNKYLKGGDKVKGVTDKFLFATHNCWHCFDSRPLMEANGDGPLYPRDSTDKAKYDTDLNTLHIRNLRGKFGQSGMVTVVVVSQSEGLLPSLTEFHYIKENERYGLEGNVQNYSLALYPDVKLSRTTVRNKIDTDNKLRRALNITSEMCQMNSTWHVTDPELKKTPKQLYDEIKALGYDWDMILDKTRSWWTTDNDSPKHDLLFLSTMDLLNIARGKYFPYWLESDKKNIKKAYVKK
jgi:hypothetical protein